MIEGTRRWFRRNRTNLLIGAGVVGAGYVAGQYVLGKIQEARQRMSEDRISKEKYATYFPKISSIELISSLAAFVDDSNKTRRTAHIPFWHYSLPSGKRLLAHCLSNR